MKEEGHLERPEACFCVEARRFGRRHFFEIGTEMILLFPGPAGAAAERVLLVSGGKRADIGDKAFREALTATARALADLG